MNLKKRLNIFILIIFVVSLIAILNIKVTTQQGINYQWRTIKIPLYLKILDFFDRHYNYKELIKRITTDTKTDKERAMKIFEWTYQNIKRAPSGFPVVDDHVWHIIIRGYGMPDQSSDVFTTLCNYASMDAFFSKVYTKDRTSMIILSFVKLDERWKVFDPYNGVYFKNKNGDVVNIDEIKNGDWTIVNIGEIKNFDYGVFFENLPVIKKIGLNRSNIQSPLRRFIFEVRKWIKLK